MEQQWNADDDENCGRTCVNLEREEKRSAAAASGNLTMGPGRMFANSIRARAHSHGHAHDCRHAHARGYYHGHKKYIIGNRHCP